MHNPKTTTFQKKVNNVECSSNYDGEAKVGVVEWTKNKNPVSCPFGKKDTKKYGFDVNKADRIFDLLLQEGHITLPSNHCFPSVEELKKRKYCKWHDAMSHNTNE